MLKKILVYILCFVMLASASTVYADFANGINWSMKIEGEWYTENSASISVQTASGASGGAIAVLRTDEASSEHYIGYDVVISKAGVYQIALCVNPQGKKKVGGFGDPNYSSFSVEADGNRVDISPLAYGEDAETAGMKIYKVNLPLTYGINNIRLIASQSRFLDGTDYALSVDYLSLIYKSGTRTLRVEGEMIAAEDVLLPSDVILAPTGNTNAALLSQGKMYRFYSASAASWSYQVTAAEEGSYSIGLACFQLGASWSTDYQIRINGSKTVGMNLLNTQVVNQGVVGTAETAGDAGVYRYKINETVTLLEGVNTVEILLNPDDIVASVSQYRQVIDYIEFVRGGSMIPSDVTVEGESFGDPAFKVFTPGFSKTNLSGGDAACYYYNPYTGAPEIKTATYEFYVAREDDYMLYIYGTSPLAHANTLAWASAYTITLDGIDISINSSTWQKTGTLGSASAPYDINIFCVSMRKNSVRLSQGTHTMVFTVTAQATGGTARHYFLLDKFSFVTVPPPEVMDMSLATSLVKAGAVTTADVTLYDAVGNTMDLLKHPVAYTTSNENIARIDGVGNITANAPGTAVITAHCTAGGQTFTKQASLKIVSTSAVDVLDVKYENGSITVKATAWTADARAVFIACVSGTENGMTTSILREATHAVTQWRPGLAEDIVIPIGNLSSGETLELFVWQLDNGLVAHTQPFEM